MAFFKMKVDDEVYELTKLTLGDACVMKRDFGMHDLSFFSPTDPSQILGLVSLAIVKKEGISLEDAKKRAEQLDIEAFEQVEDEAADGEPDPQNGGDEEGKEATAGRKGRGSSAKSQKKPGSRS